ncbi:hypothetical protein Nmel_018593, partial [Mimus melanotis]
GRTGARRRDLSWDSLVPPPSRPCPIKPPLLGSPLPFRHWPRREAPVPRLSRSRVRTWAVPCPFCARFIPLPVPPCFKTLRPRFSYSFCTSPWGEAVSQSGVETWIVLYLCCTCAVPVLYSCRAVPCPPCPASCPLTMRRSRRRWLHVPLLLLTVAACVTDAATLRKDSSELLNAGWGGRDDGYRNGEGLDCQKCPAGTQCVPARTAPSAPRSTPVRCARSASPGGSSARGGSWGIPAGAAGADPPCVPFPRCPEGQEVLKPCTPDRDLQCGPAKDSSTRGYWAIGVIAGILVILLITGFCVWKHCCRSSGDGRSSSKGLNWVVSSWHGRGGWLCLWAGVRSPIPSAPHLASSCWEGWRSRGMRLIQVGRLEEQGDEAHAAIPGEAGGAGG